MRPGAGQPTRPMDYTTRRLYGQYFTRWRCQLPSVKKTRAHGNKECAARSPRRLPLRMRPIIGAFRGDVSVSGRLSRHLKARGVEMRQNLQALRAAYHGGIGKFSWENGLCLLVAQQTPRLPRFVRVRTLRRHRPLIGGFGPGTKPMASGAGRRRRANQRSSMLPPRRFDYDQVGGRSVVARPPTTWCPCARSAQ